MTLTSQAAVQNVAGKLGSDGRILVRESGYRASGARYGRGAKT